MTPIVHRTYISTLVLITLGSTLYLAFTGYSYYILPIEERFYHPRYDWFKPAGVMGHGLGILGTFMILFGVVIYMTHKKYNVLGRHVRLKYLLEFHIFLCFLGSIFILFHTSFKFGGLVSIAFWSMVAVVISGIIGRYIYIQIPRTIEGRELSLNEVQSMRASLQKEVEAVGLSQELQVLIDKARTLKATSYLDRIKTWSFLRKIRSGLRSSVMDTQIQKKLLQNISSEISLAQRIGRLQTMQKLFKYWHVAHLPFALIMLVIVLIHVVVTVALGYKWIF